MNLISLYYVLCLILFCFFVDLYIYIYIYIYMYICACMSVIGKGDKGMKALGCICIISKLPIRYMIFICKM